MASLVHGFKETVALRRQHDVTPTAVFGVLPSPDQTLRTHFLELPRDSSGINPELAGQFDGAQFPLCCSQRPQHGKLRGRHPDLSRKTGHENLVGSDDFTKQVRLVAFVMRFRENRLLKFIHAGMVDDIIDMVNYIIQQIT
jgi:hypothetical protein